MTMIISIYSHLQLSISILHSCLSMGKNCRFIGHEAVMVNLYEYIANDSHFVIRNDGWIWLLMKKGINWPNATIDLALVRDTEKLVGSGRHVQVARLFIGEERVGYPDVFQVFGAYHDAFDSGQTIEWQPWIHPVLSEIKVRCKILWCETIPKEQKEKKIRIRIQITT